MLLTIISSASVSATIDIANPADNTITNQPTVSFDYYASFENITLTRCKLIIDTETKATSNNITNPGLNSFTANLSMGVHSWSISCDYDNTSEASEERTITIDPIKPTIVLFFPVNNSGINSSEVDISFVALDNFADNISCNIIINNNINKSITATNSIPFTTSMSLEEGQYSWQISCTDYANNTETSEKRIFTMSPPPPPPEFNITIPGTVIETGENTLMTINAPQGTSIRVEVCPDKPGFVECKVPVNAQNIMNYPFQEWLPYTNYEGNYALEAFFNYSGFTEVKTIDYSVHNNIQLDINTHQEQRQNVPVELEAKASGGAGALNYTWHLSDGSVINSKKANITYTTTGEYTNTVSVKDAYNNTMNKSINIIVEGTYNIKIVVKDSVTNAPILKASVDIENEEKETDANGEATYYLKSGPKDTFVLKENYTTYHQDLTISKSETITIALDPETIETPVVTLLRPENNAGITGTATELAFRSEFAKELNCSFYINENNDGFYSYLGSLQIEANSNDEHPYGVIELENKSYWWKVECTDNNGNSGMSETWMFTVGGEPLLVEAAQASDENSASKAYDNWINEFQLILDTIESLPNDEKEAADALGISTNIQNSITVFKNTIRDLDALRFRDDLTDDDKQAEGERLVQQAEETYQRTPVSIELLGKESFLDYVKADELEGLVDQYLELTNASLSMSKKSLMKYLNELQQEVVISTRVKSARISYRDGTQSDTSIIFRDIKTYNITAGTFIMEIIPKDVAQDAGDIMSSQKYEVVLQDPVIKFSLPGDTVISYYFGANLDLEQLKKIKTVLLVDPASIESNQKITGFSINNLPIPKIKGVIFIPIIIVLLGGLVFAGIRYDGINTARYLAYKVYGKRSTHYISVILNEINDNLDSSDFKKAAELYEEAKGAYSELSPIAKNDVYEQVTQAAARIKEYHDAMQTQGSINEMKELLNNIQGLLNNGQIAPALEEYKKIEAAYSRLDDEVREMMHPTLVTLCNKIQIAIDNNQNLI
jgi:hypothetical protein